LNLKKSKYQACTDPMLSHINVGTGVDITIKELIELIQNIVDFKGEVIFDKNQPDGAMRKLIDPSRLSSMGWQYSIEISEGLKTTYHWYLKNKA